VAHLQRDGVIVWCSLVTPCMSIFLPMFVDASIPESLAQGNATFSATSPWWRIKRLLDHAAANWGERMPRLRAHWQDWQQSLLRDAAQYRGAAADHKSRWMNDNVTRLLREIGTLERALGLATR
ncbi:MAG: hypothetical protein JOZ44_14725, partial [Acidobacteria bacterium]|nr:hypothetical protein [Acidobacteriota bacterium]